MGEVLKRFDSVCNMLTRLTELETNTFPPTTSATMKARTYSGNGLNIENLQSTNRFSAILSPLFWSSHMKEQLVWPPIMLKDGGHGSHALHSVTRIGWRLRERRKDWELLKGARSFGLHSKLCKMLLRTAWKLTPGSFLHILQPGRQLVTGN